MATRWLIEEKLNWDKPKVCECLKYDKFKNNKLGNIYVNMFNCSTIQVLENAYPGVYKREGNRIVLQ